MRTWIVALFVLTCLVAPLAAHAASQPAAAASFQPAAVAANPFQLPAEPAAQPAVAPQVAGFLQFIATTGTSRQLGKVCSISCRECVSTCPPGEGVCFHGGC